MGFILPEFDRTRALAAFDDYVGNFNLVDQRIFLKYEHTMEVAKLCEEIATVNRMSSDDVDLVWLCGLLHDIGRFEQLQNWNTFRDSDSISHAKLGVAVLDGKKTPGFDFIHENNLLVRFTKNAEWARVIRFAVGVHSDYKLPADLDFRTRGFCEILRDADKIDIIRVFSQNSCESVLELSSEKFIDGEISDVAMTCFRDQRCIGPHERKTHLDRLVGVACLAFEIVNDSGIEALRKHEYMEDLINHPFGIDMSFTKRDTQKKWNEISSSVRELVSK